MCVGEGGGVSGREKKKKTPLSYMHMAVHQLIAGKSGGWGVERKTKGSSFTVLPVVAPCSCVSAELHYFGEMKGGRGRRGVSNVCVMSKKGIKIKGRREGGREGGGAFAGRNQPLLYHRGKEANKSRGNENK